MKKTNAALKLAVALLALTLGTTAFAQQPPDNVQGNWTIYSSRVNGGGVEIKHVQIAQYGNHITGYFEGPVQSGPIEGEVHGHRVRFNTVTPNVLHFSGRCLWRHHVRNLWHPRQARPVAGHASGHDCDCSSAQQRGGVFGSARIGSADRAIGISSACADHLSDSSSDSSSGVGLLVRASNCAVPGDEQRSANHISTGLWPSSSAGAAVVRSTQLSGGSHRAVSRRPSGAGASGRYESGPDRIRR